MENKNFVHTPLWVRFVSICALVLTLSLALGVAWFYIEHEKENWVLVSMSVAQVSASGLIVVLLVFFSEKDVGVIGLQGMTDAFLARTLPRSLMFIDFPQATAIDWTRHRISLRRIKRNLKNSPTRIKIRHNAGENAAFYHIGALGTKLALRVQVNVRELTVSYYFPADSDEQIDTLKSELEWALSRFVEVGGYQASWYFSKEDFDGRHYVSVHLTTMFAENFLDDERQKLQFAQDLAASTRSLIKDCKSRGIALTHSDANNATSPGSAAMS